MALQVRITPLAGVAEQADAQDLKSCGVKSVPVRSRSSAPKSRLKKQPGFLFFGLPFCEFCFLYAAFY